MTSATKGTRCGVDRPARDVGQLYVKTAQLSFGDLFQSQVLFDAHLRGDATPLSSNRFGKDGSKLAYLPQSTQQDFILAHGLSCRAVVISDDCAIDDALGVDRERQEMRGRVLFAAVYDATEEEVKGVEQTKPFDRFGLKGEGAVAPGIVELRKVFMVDIHDVHDSLDQRIATLDDDLSGQLAVRWSAFANRRGPLAAADRASKLAKLIAGNDHPSAQHRAVGRAVAQVVADAWTFEGRDLEAVSTTKPDELKTVVEGMRSGLQRLMESTGAAIDALTQN